MPKSFKCLLNEYYQKNHLSSPPAYFVERKVAHSLPVFSAHVSVDGRLFYGQDFQKSIKAAEQSAAKAACAALGINDAKSTNQYDSWFSEGDTETSLRDSFEQELGNYASNVPLSCNETNSLLGTEHMPLYAYFDNQESLEEPSTQELKESREDKLKQSENSSPKPKTMEKTFKCILSDKAQRGVAVPPVYETDVVCSKDCNCFTSSVLFDGKTYRSEMHFKSERAAEHNAATVCLESLNSLPDDKHGDAVSDEKQLGTNRFHLESLSKTQDDRDTKPDDCCYKSVLQVYIQQRGLSFPTYITNPTENGMFTSTCEIEGKYFQSKIPQLRKKTAQQSAAREALIYFEVGNPERIDSYLKNKRKRKFHIAKRRLNQRSEYNETKAKQFGQTCGDSYLDWSPLTQLNFGKNEKVGCSYSVTEDLVINGTLLTKMLDISVCEDWPDRADLVVIGNSCFSIPMKCHGRKKQLFCVQENRNIQLKPGANIRGLVCRYLMIGNQVYLNAESCQEILYPEKPLPVLLSCGVVYIYHNPQIRKSMQVVLKRYLNSLAFVHVSHNLAQWFRRYINNKQYQLDISSVVMHIQSWLDIEVNSLAEMTPHSLRYILSTILKFKESWMDVFLFGMPYDLIRLQRHCLSELHRRNCSQEDFDDNQRRPWDLPKGNFKHRVLSSGVFLESPIECAIRELDEETGLKISLKELESSSFVDITILDSENINPHKGDFVRYYIYVYKKGPVDDFHEDNCDIHDDNLLLNSNETGEATCPKSIPTRTEVKQGMKRKREEEFPLNDGKKLKPTLYDYVEENKVVQDDELEVFDEEPIRTTINEECTWKPIDMALKVSPVFKRIHETKVFQELLVQLNQKVRHEKHTQY